MLIRLLGAVEVRLDGRADVPAPPRGLRLRGLLARLALDADRPVGAATLIDDLWGESPPDGAGNALQALVSRLRRAIGGEAVRTEQGGYRLRIDPRDVDALRFTSLTAEAAGAEPADAVALLREALELWHGPPLADVLALPFAGPAAARLSDRRASAVEDAARHGLLTGAVDIDALAAQLDAMPLRESTAALLARGLYRRGRQADALAVLDRTRDRLVEELGVDPGPELAAVRLAVLRGEDPPDLRQGGLASTGLPQQGGFAAAGLQQGGLAAAGPAPAAVAVAIADPPGSPNRFVGRSHDIARVRELLTGTRLVTLTGPGGAGKTRLAHEATRDRAVVVAELASLTAGDQLLPALLAAAGGAGLVTSGADGPLAAARTTDGSTGHPPGPDGPRPPSTNGSPPSSLGPESAEVIARLLAALDSPDLLLVLDNCEHLVDDAAGVAAMLLSNLPRLRVLATSREPLGVPGEVLHPVDALGEADAVALFVERGAAVRPGFTLDGEVEQAVVEICRRLDGQPLPIELAAARLRVLSPSEIAERLDDRFRLLTSGYRTALPRHQTLRAVVDWSWDLLSEPERAVARRLGVFAGGASAASAERVCSRPAGPARGEIFELLAALVDKSLVVAVPQAAGRPTRYRMLETIRAYAVERLDEAGERAVAVAEHAAVVLALAEEAESHLRSAEQLSWLDRLREESGEIDLALRRAVETGDSDTAYRLAAAMTWSWFVRGLIGDATRWVEAVHPLDGPAPPAAVAITTSFLALNTMSQGDFPTARRHVDAALRIIGRLPPPLHPVLQLVGPGTELFTQSDDRAIRTLSQSSEDPWVRAVALQLLAQVAENDGEADEQRLLLRAAHALFVEVGDRFGLGMVVHALGELEDTAGEYDAAARAYDEAIALATELGNDDDLPQYLARRAQLDIRRGDLDSARTGLLHALEVAGDRPSGLDVGLWAATAQLDLATGDLDAARANLDRVEKELTGGAGFAQRRAHVAITRADVELAARDLPAARRELAVAVEAAIESRDGPVAAFVTEVAARLALAEADAGSAATLLGVAAAQRGTVDRGNPLVRAAHYAVAQALGADAAERAIRRGRELPRADGLAVLAEFAQRRDDVG